MISRNINDDSTLSYLFNKGEKGLETSVKELEAKIANKAKFRNIGGWDVVEWDNGFIEANIHITGTLTNYAVVGPFYGYYTSVTLPVTMKDTDYFISQTWQIGNGFTWAGATLGKSRTSCNIYAVATTSGTQTYHCYLYIRGYRA